MIAAGLDFWARGDLDDQGWPRPEYEAARHTVAEVIAGLHATLTKK